MEYGCKSDQVAIIKFSSKKNEDISICSNEGALSRKLFRVQQGDVTYFFSQAISKKDLLEESYCQPIRKAIDGMLERLYGGLEQDSDDNYSVYTGIGGISLLQLHLYEVYGQDKNKLESAVDYLKHPLRHLKGRRISFLCGDAGPLALAGVIYHKLGNSSASSKYIKRLEALNHQVCEDPSLPDELLYGRAGYLYSLLFVNAHIGEGCIDSGIIERVFKSIIDSGIKLSQQQGWKHPLMYAWHEKHYLGAAHGLAGIFYLLMQVTDTSVKKYIEELVKPSIEYMLTLRFPSGNCPSSIGSSTGDKLVHWCHGAPGWIHMFIMAYKLFGDHRFLQAAKDCADVIWSRGLLTKGYSICHGVAGNGYAFLALYNLTEDQKYLYRACKFAEWCSDYGKHGCRKPDHPFSLFEDMMNRCDNESHQLVHKCLAGCIYFLADMLNPRNAKFPAFYLPK